MWTSFGLTLLFICAFYCKVQSTSHMKLVKRQVSSPDAVCNDKSRAIFYIRMPQMTRKWIIFFESGGLCSSKDECNSRYSKEDSRVLMTSTGMPEKIEGRDMLSNDPHENPDFYDFNHVLVPYCSSDLWLGSRTNPANFSFVDDSEVNNFSFRGHTIFTSVIFDLMNDFNLSQSEVVVLSGSSAGAVGVLNHASWFADDFVQKNNFSTKVLTIIDSGWFIDFQESIVSGFKIKTDFIQMANISMSGACADLSYGFPCCMSASCMLTRGFFPKNLPVMFVFSLYDVYMLSKAIEKLADKTDLEERVGDLVSLVNMYGGAMKESLDSTRLAKMSYFVPACFQHVYFGTSSLWDKEGGVLNSEIDVSRGTAKFSHKVRSGIWEEIKVPSQNKTGNLRSALTRWISDTASPIRIVDSCLGAHCNPTCPDKLVFFDPSKEWSGLLQYMVLGVSLLATVVCVTIKLSFMIYLAYVTRYQRSYNRKSVESKKRKEFPPCKSDESVSIACLSLTYHVLTQKNHAKENVAGKKNKQKEYLKGEGNENEGGDDVSDSSSSSSSLSEDDADDERDEENTFDVLRSFESVISDEANEPVRSPPGKQSSSPRNDQGTDLPARKSAESLKTGSRAALVEGDEEAGKGKWFKSRKKSASRKKQILNGVSSYFNPGELVAIMGPSGCGKTTLLDLLTGRRRTGERKGCVFINGVELKDVQEWYGKMVGYVLQLAVPFYEELTVRQNMTFAAHMRLPSSMKNEDKFERIEQIIEETGLGPMANTVVGGHIGPGLSGGQKRRLCVALQMINMPPAIFLDEPTSGLDALSSLELLGHLNLVAESGRLVVLTIHQPRLEIFHLFHKILLLCEGQVAYYGDPSVAPKVFIQAYGQATSEEFRKSSIAPKIDAKNPADTIMDILGCKEARHAILDFYQESGEPEAVKEAITQHRKYSAFFKSISNLKSKRQSGDAGMLKRVFVLESRTALRQTLGQILYFPLIFFIFGIIIGTVYYQAEERDGILLMSGYCVYCCASPLFLSSVLMAHLNKALDVYRLEYQDGIGRSHENVIQTFVRVVSLCAFPVIMCSTMSYFMVMIVFDPWQFFILTVISLVLNQTWIAVYMMVICASPSIAHRICPMVSAIGGFAGGFLVPKPQMPIVYDLLFYINPQYYGYSAIAKVLLKDKLLGCKYDSTLNCRSNDGNAVLSNFGFDVVNPYEHLVIMLGMTAVSLLLSWLFLEMRNWDFKSLFAKPADTSFYVEQEIEDLVVASSEGVSMQPYPEKAVSSPVGILARSASTRSTLGVIHGDKGHHAVRFATQSKEKLIVNQVLYGSLNQPQAQSGWQKARDAHARTKWVFSNKERRARWQQHLEERKYNMEREMRKVQKIARRMSISQPSCAVRRHTFAVSKRNAIPSTLSSSKPISRDTRPQTERKAVSPYEPDRKLGPEASQDHMDGENGPTVGALGQRVRRRSEQTVSSLENIDEILYSDEENVFFHPTQEQNQQQSSPRTPSDTDVVAV